jgi:Tol biopolymer transport system component
VSAKHSGRLPRVISYGLTPSSYKMSGLLSSTKTYCCAALAILTLTAIPLSCSDVNSPQPVDIIRQDRLAVWNPQGGSIAYEHVQAEGDSQVGGIYIINEDGSNKRLLVRGGSRPAWHPSGRMLAYTYDAVYILDLETGNKKQVIPGNAGLGPNFSSDGKYLAFSDISVPSDSSSFSDWYRIRICDLEANTSYLILNDSPADAGSWLYCSWKPYSHELMCRRQLSEYWLFDSEGQNLRLLLPAASAPCWSPGGDSICYSTVTNRNEWQTIIWNLKDDSKTSIGKRSYASFSPDGKKIVHTQGEGDVTNPANGRYILMIFDLITGEVKHLTR